MSRPLDYRGTSRRAVITARAARAGLTLTTWSPGDGHTRYRFAVAGSPGSDDYFSAGAEVGATCLGIAEAETWLSGYLAGKRAR